MLKAVLRKMPDVQWIPSDVCAASLTELVTSPLPARQHVFNLANSEIIPWPKVITSIAKFCDVDKISLLTEADYIDLLGRVEEPIPVKRLIPSLHGLTQKAGLPDRYTLLDTKSTCQWSRTLSSCPAIDDGYLAHVVELLLKGEDEVHLTSSSPVLIFGPWSEGTDVEVLPTISERVLAAAERTKASIGLVKEE